MPPSPPGHAGPGGARRTWRAARGARPTRPSQHRPSRRPRCRSPRPARGSRRCRGPHWAARTRRAAPTDPGTAGTAAARAARAARGRGSSARPGRPSPGIRRRLPLTRQFIVNVTRYEGGGMADITRRLFLRHLRGAPTTWVRHHVRGKVRHEGIGQSFWYRPLTAVLSEVPIDDRELPLLFHARTSDFADVTVQATVTYRVADPAKASSRLDFSIDPVGGNWRAKPLDQIATLLAELAQQPALDLLARVPLTDAMTAGLASVRDAVSAALSEDERLTETGVGVVSARVVAIRPEPELERALQTPTREQVQQDADAATYERRAKAVERERAIAEN